MWLFVCVSGFSLLYLRPDQNAGLHFEKTAAGGLNGSFRVSISIRLRLGAREFMSLMDPHKDKCDGVCVCACLCV